MGYESGIEWTRHTFNPWWGCAKVSAGCKNCYAQPWARRLGLEVWGEDSPRRTFGDAHWREPLRWHARALAKGERHRVFCASMADVFENRRELDAWRERLWTLIDETPALDWLLLTKRPECVAQLVPWRDDWPTNVWLGTTAENQEMAEARLPALVRCRAAIRFVSCEPLLSAVDLHPWLSTGQLHWVIAGGESTAKARPMHPEWPESLRAQCQAAGVPFLFKQWGHWGPDAGAAPGRARSIELTNQDGGTRRLFALGKHATGRILQERTWDEYPFPATARHA